MVYPVFAVRDIKTSFFPPQVHQSREDAIRAFAMMVNSPSGVMGFAPKDFDLFYVADFDTEKGEIISVQPIEFIVTGSALVGVKDEK